MKRMELRDLSGQLQSVCIFPVNRRALQSLHRARLMILHDRIQLVELLIKASAYSYHHSI